MPKFTNVTKGPKTLNTEGGPLLVGPGETVEASLSDAEAKVAKGTEWWGSEADVKKAEKDEAEAKAKADAARRS